MDAKSVKRHFDRAYKDGPVMLAKVESGYLATDGYAMYRLYDNHVAEAFADRNKYPNLPTVTGAGWHAGAALVEPVVWEPGQGTNLEGLFDGMFSDVECPVNLTNWHLTTADGDLLRLFPRAGLTANTTVGDFANGVTVNTRYLAPLTGKGLSLSDFTFAVSGQRGALLVYRLDAPQAVIMPVATDYVFKHMGV